MKLKLIRDTFTDKSTIGKLYIDDVYFCETLEDVVRAIKIPNETAIYNGIYEVIIDPSDRFKRLMPHILNVPHFTGVRIHWGNTCKDTDGCVLIGFKRSLDTISESKLAFDAFFPRLIEGLNQGKVFIEIDIIDKIYKIDKESNKTQIQPSNTTEV